MRAENTKELYETLAEENPEAILFRDPDYTGALVGLAENGHQNLVAVYDAEGCIEWLMRDQEIEYEAAAEWFSYNTMRGLLYADENQRPIVLGYSAFATVDAFSDLAKRTLGLQQAVDDMVTDRKATQALEKEVFASAKTAVREANVVIKHEQQKNELIATKTVEILGRHLSPEDVQKALIELAQIEEAH